MKGYTLAICVLYLAATCFAEVYFQEEFSGNF